jgi:hypothetical protein
MRDIVAHSREYHASIRIERLSIDPPTTLTRQPSHYLCNVINLTKPRTGARLLYDFSPRFFPCRIISSLCRRGGCLRHCRTDAHSVDRAVVLFGQFDRPLLR